MSSPKVHQSEGNIVTRPHVVVGVDGSPESAAAARWASDEAVRRHEELQLIYSSFLPVLGYPAMGYPIGFVELADRQGRDLLANMAREIHARHPGLNLTTEQFHSDPRQALVDSSRAANLTVVGNRGGGRLTDLMVGSVALHVTAHAFSPVAVIPEEHQRRGGPILVGVDGSVNSTAAIAFAFDEAAVRGVDLVAVLTVDGLGAQGFVSSSLESSAAGTQEEHAVMSEELAGWREKYPDVSVRQEVFRGQAADCLVGYAEHAPPAQQPQMIVVGSRGRGALTGLLLGSTSHALISHAKCPVVVVRPMQGH
jgi:nucleotide-binding universal stress UspA family protein